MTSRQKALAIIPKCTGFLSFAGSMFIMQDVMKNKMKRGKVYHRLILGLSIFDMMASVANVFSTWPMPADTPNVYGAVGTTGTCTAQGFFAETGNVCTPLYNASLCVYFMLVIRQGWSEKKIKKYEPWFHVVPLITGWTMGFVGLPFNLYNNSGWLCWYAPLPQGCRHSEAGCERGEHAWIFRYVHYAIIWSAILFVTWGMFLIYRMVLTKERASAKYTRRDSVTGSGGRRKMSHSRKVARQAMLFVAALYLTWVFTTLTRLFQIIQGKTYFPLLILMAIFFPLQGFFNALIYLRPRYLRCREHNPELPFWRVFYQVITASAAETEISDFSSSASRRRSSILGSVSKRFSAYGRDSVGRGSDTSAGCRRMSDISEGVGSTKSDENATAYRLQRRSSDQRRLSDTSLGQKTLLTGSTADTSASATNGDAAEKPPRRRSSVLWADLEEGKERVERSPYDPVKAAAAVASAELAESSDDFEDDGPSPTGSP